jgi:hypothetical protein
MTELQKHIILALLDGANISGNKHYGYRLRNSSGHPILRFNWCTFYSIKHLLRKSKSLFVLDKRLVRKLHANTFVKKSYKAQALKQTSKTAEL